MTSTAPRGYLFSIFLASLFILHIPNVTCLPYYVVPAHVPNASVVAATVRQVELSFGGQATVRSTVDSGSGITDLACNTPITGPATPGVYTFKNTTQNNVNSSTCASLGAGNCLSGGNCYWTSALTGGSGYNVYGGIVASDLISLPESNPPLSIPSAPFGCSQSYLQCNEGDTACLDAAQGCVPVMNPITPAPRAAKQGIEFGFTFSQASTPTELVRRGMIDPVLALCFRQSAAATNCSAVSTIDSYVVLGKGPQPAGITEVPIIFTPIAFESAIPAPNSALTGSTFRSYMENITVSTFNSSSPNTTAFSTPYRVLWDSGAYGKMAIGPAGYSAYLSYFQSALSVANSTGPFASLFQTCDPHVLCGQNWMGYPDSPGPGACLSLPVSSTSDPSVIQPALSALQSLYPNITLGLNGASVAIPSTSPIISCLTSSVAVCSYISNGNPWIAAPWFDGKWVQFDTSAPMQGYGWSNGTMSFANVGDCGFLNEQDGGNGDASVPVGPTSTATVVTTTGKPSGAGKRGGIGLWIAGLVGVVVGIAI